ncbi:MAG: FAD-dependent oxidoreductase [Gaiellales bacterium]
MTAGPSGQLGEAPVERRDVVVVGGGIAGLAAAWHLRDRDVVVLEESSRIGGRLMSEARGDVWLNFGAHVFSGPDSASGRLIDEAGVRAIGVPGKLAAVAMDGRIVTGAVETYPLRLPMGLRSRVALMRSGLQLRLAVRRYATIAAPRPGEDPADRQLRMLEFMGDRSFSEFIGRLPADVDGIYRATLNRSSGEPEDLAAGYGVGYFHLVWDRSGGLSRSIVGGPGVLIDRLAAGLPEHVRTCSHVRRVRPSGDGVLVEYAHAGEERAVVARAAVVATTAPVARSNVEGLPAATAMALEQVRYGPYAVAAILTDDPRPMPWDDIYARATPGCSFNMVFTMSNVAAAAGGLGHPRQGSFMMYAGADQGRRMLELEDDQIAARFADDLARVYPASRGRVREVVVRRWERGLPYAHVGRARLQRALAAPLAPIHLVGDYLGSWYTETAAQTAARAASAIRRDLES